MNALRAAAIRDDYLFLGLPVCRHHSAQILEVPHLFDLFAIQVDQPLIRIIAYSRRYCFGQNRVCCRFLLFA